MLERGAADARALMRTIRHGDLQALRAAAWALRAAHDARRSMRDGGIRTLALPAVPDLDAAAGVGVEAMLRRTRYSCLERSVVRQAWGAAHGDTRDVIIGISGTEDFGAHAWLEGDPPSSSGGFHEIMRHPPPAQPAV